MAKKVKILECCVLTKDDKGALSLVGKAKEAITSLIKNKIDVTIALSDTSKEEAEKFLKECMQRKKSQKSSMKKNRERTS